MGAFRPKLFPAVSRGVPEFPANLSFTSALRPSADLAGGQVVALSGESVVKATLVSAAVAALGGRRGAAAPGDECCCCCPPPWWWKKTSAAAGGGAHGRARNEPPGVTARHQVGDDERPGGRHQPVTAHPAGVGVLLTRRPPCPAPSRVASLGVSDQSRPAYLKRSVLASVCRTAPARGGRRPKPILAELVKRSQEVK